MDQIKFLGVCIIIAALILGGAIILAPKAMLASQPTSTATASMVATAVVTQGSSTGFNLAGKTPRGNANAPITIIDVSDFQCPYCGRAKPTIDQLLSAYPGKIKLYFIHFPLDFHEFAEKASEAAECAGEQGKFWEYHDLLFANQNALDVVSLKKYAKQLNLDSTKFDSCLDSGAKASVVSADFQQGVKAGVTGTPMFFMNGVKVCGAQPYAVFKQVVDALLAGQRPSDAC